MTSHELAKELLSLPDMVVTLSVVNNNAPYLHEVKSASEIYAVSYLPYDETQSLSPDSVIVISHQ